MNRVIELDLINIVKLIYCSVVPDLCVIDVGSMYREPIKSPICLLFKHICYSYTDRCQQLCAKKKNTVEGHSKALQIA